MGCLKWRPEVAPSPIFSGIPRTHHRCRSGRSIGQLHVTHIGAFPSAPHHYVEREAGTPQSILIYCLEGRGFLEMNHSTFSIEQGHVVVIPPITTQS